MTTPDGRGKTGASLVPADLVAVLAVAAVSFGTVVLSGEYPAPFRAVVGALAVFVVPGYALVAALFPAGSGQWTPGEKRRLDGAERLVLGTGLSLVAVALLGVALGLTVGLEPAVVVGSTSVLTVTATVVAVLRRRRLSPTERYRIAPTLTGIRSRVAAVRSRSLDRTDFIILVVALSTVVAGASIGYAMTQRPAGETPTEFAVLTENDDGELVADGYPTAFTRGESKPLVILVGNHERESRSYTVVVMLGGEGGRQLNEFRFSQLAAGGTATIEREITPSTVGESQRLSFLLYRGEPPSDPSVENAYREVHLWIDVTA
jgi:uncharacterized membrane protein